MDKSKETALACLASLSFWLLPFKSASRWCKGSHKTLRRSRFWFESRSRYYELRDALTRLRKPRDDAAPSPPDVAVQRTRPTGVTDFP